MIAYVRSKYYKYAPQMWCRRIHAFGEPVGTRLRLGGPEPAEWQGMVQHEA